MHNKAETMNILIVSDRSDLFGEWEDFAGTLDASVFFAVDHQEAVRLLERQPVDVAVLDIRALGDLGLLKYINDTHGNVRVMLITPERMSDIVSVMRDGQYSLVGDDLDVGAMRRMLQEAVRESER